MSITFLEIGNIVVMILLFAKTDYSCRIFNWFCIDGSASHFYMSAGLVQQGFYAVAWRQILCFHAYLFLTLMPE